MGTDNHFVFGANLKYMYATKVSKEMGRIAPKKVVLNGVIFFVKY